MYVGYNGVFVSFWNVDTRGTSLGADKGFLYCVWMICSGPIIFCTGSHMWYICQNGNAYRSGKNRVYAPRHIWLQGDILNDNHDINPGVKLTMLGNWSPAGWYRILKKMQNEFKGKCRDEVVNVLLATEYVNPSITESLWVGFYFIAT